MCIVWLAMAVPVHAHAFDAVLTANAFAHKNFAMEKLHSALIFRRCDYRICIIFYGDDCISILYATLRLAASLT